MPPSAQAGGRAAGRDRAHDRAAREQDRYLGLDARGTRDELGKAIAGHVAGQLGIPQAP